MLHQIVNQFNRLEIVKKLSFNYKARVDFYYQVAKLTGEAELNFIQALREIQSMQLQGESAKTSIKTALYYVYYDILAMLVSGASLSNAMHKYIPETDKTMISSFEGSDNFSKGFEDLVIYNDSIKNMQKEIKKAIIYPCFMLVFLLCALSYFSLSIIPQLTTTMLPNTPLSTVSSVMIWLSKNYFIWFPLVLILLILSAAFLIWSLPNMNNKFRVKLEQYPPYSLYRVKIGCTFMAALNNLTKAELTQSEAIEKMYKISRPYLKYRLQIIHNQLKHGKSLGATLQDSKLNFPDKKIVAYLAVLSKHGVLEEALDKITATVLERGLELVQKQAAILKYAITMFVAAGILFSFSSIYLISQDMSGGLETQQVK